MCDIVLCERQDEAMDAQLKRGIIEVCVLTVLRRGDSYGYRLVKDVSVLLPLTESTLYPILKRLESGGAVTTYSVEHSGRLRKYYRITETGNARIRDFIEEWKVLMHIYNAIEEEFES